MSDAKKPVLQVLFRWDQSKREWVFDPGPASKKDVRLMLAKDPGRVELSRAGGKKRGGEQTKKAEQRWTRLRAEYEKRKKKNPRLSEQKIADLEGVSLKVLRKALGKKV